MEKNINLEKIENIADARAVRNRPSKIIVSIKTENNSVRYFFLLFFF